MASHLCLGDASAAVIAFDNHSWLQYLRVRMCRSRCSSRVNDCPQYVQNTMVAAHYQYQTVGDLDLRSKRVGSNDYAEDNE